MRLMVISLVLGSAAAVPASSLVSLPTLDDLQQIKIDSNWLPKFAQQTSPRFTFAPVKSEEVVKSILATGTLVPSLNVEVGSILSGQVTKLLVDFNDRVVKGQVLTELDDRSYALSVDAARAALEGARFEIKGYEARLKRTTLDLWQTEHQLPVFQARVETARISLEAAERDLKRKQWLQEREVAAIADVQNMQSRRDGALSSLREAETNLANQTGLVTAAKVDVDRARAELALSQAAEVKLEAIWRSASVDLERTKIRSPIDGVIVGRSVTEGQTLATGLEAKTLFTIAGDLGSMEILARINESDIAAIKNGLTATYTVDAFPGKTFEAQVKQIRLAPQVLSNVVTYTVVLKTTNPDGILLPGMTVMANIVTKRTSGTMTVPMSALRYRPTTVLASNNQRQNFALPDTVWVLRGDKPIPISVLKGEDDGKNVIVSSQQLRPHDMVITGEASSQPSQ